MSAPLRLKIALLLGSTRTEGVPRPTNVGRRVGYFIESALTERGHAVDVIDPTVEQLPLLKRPHFSYPKGESPHEDLAERLGAAQAYVMCTPEYNHAPGPALVNMINHFGSSTFSYKPSAIVSYSQGQWGGARAAIALRPILSELGCIPVSSMVHFPSAHQLLTPEGGFVDGKEAEKKWVGYSNRTWGQLEWWGEACVRQREISDPFDASPALQKAPNQRNAPGKG